MLRIEVVNKKERKGLIVNSIIDEEAEFGYEESKKYSSGFYIFDATLQNKNVFNEVIQYSFDEISRYFDGIVFFDTRFGNWKYEVNYRISLCDTSLFPNEDYELPFIHIQLFVEPDEWAEPYSILDLAQIFDKIVSKNLDYSFERSDSTGGFSEFTYKFKVENSKILIKQKIDEISAIINKTLHDSIKILLQNLDKDLITSYFTFPEEIKVACKQYLVYFAQFLMDLGIEADTEMKEESQQTLFKVIPKNKEESLDKIREALNVYLNIPKDFDIQVAQNNDVAVMQWQANVMHWKSQAMLAQSVIQMKDATIEVLQLSNYQYKELLGNKKAEEKPKNEEEIAGGLVKVKELDVNGLSFNLPELLRRLKRRFK